MNEKGKEKGSGKESEKSKIEQIQRKRNEKRIMEREEGTGNEK